MLKVKIKYHNEGLVRIVKVKQGDWIDLRSAEQKWMRKDEYALISLGVSVQLPRGYEAHIVPRSSTYKNFGIIQANGIGIIDNSYSGDFDIWKFPAIAMRDTIVNVNDRICQFRLVKNQQKLRFETVSHLFNKTRGGFGSTGKN